MRLAAEAEELGLQLDLHGSLGQPGAGESPGAQVALNGGVDSAAHVRKFECILGTSTLGERLADALGRVLVHDHFKGRPVLDAVLGAALLDVAVAEQGQREAAACVEPRAERCEKSSVSIPVRSACRSAAGGSLIQTRSSIESEGVNSRQPASASQTSVAPGSATPLRY